MRSAIFLGAILIAEGMPRGISDDLIVVAMMFMGLFAVVDFVELLRT